MEALDKEIKGYAEAGDEEREDLFLEDKLLNRIGGGVRSQKMSTWLAVYLAAGTPTSIIKRKGQFTTYHMDSNGLALEMHKVNLQNFFKFKSNLQNVNDLLRSFQRIRTLAEVSELTLTDWRTKL